MTQRLCQSSCCGNRARRLAVAQMLAKMMRRGQSGLLRNVSVPQALLVRRRIELWVRVGGAMEAGVSEFFSIRKIILGKRMSVTCRGVRRSDWKR